MAPESSLQQLKHAIEAHRRSLQELNDALEEFEAALPSEEDSTRTTEQDLQLLSIADVCRLLGMGKSWTYRRVRSGEIPSVKLGRSVKVKREDLEAYLESHRFHPMDEGETSG